MTEQEIIGMRIRLAMTEEQLTDQIVKRTSMQMHIAQLQREVDLLKVLMKEEAWAVYCQAHVGVTDDMKMDFADYWADRKENLARTLANAHGVLTTRE